MRPTHSIRIPVHGFVEFSDWERDIINHPVFQRLRRIRQLAFSDHLYPGSVHTRFEHSIGVMHVATRLFDTLVHRYRHVLDSCYGGHDLCLERARILVRLAALLHDVGHSAFSHSGEGLMPDGLRHEDYTAELVRNELRDVINDNSKNKIELAIRADEVADFYLGRPTIAPELLFWKELVSGQLDADRMDYLLRDSLHCGVEYGRFDLDRLVDTLAIVEDQRDDSEPALRIGVTEGGIHAAEGLILARYFMFTQVYFHPVRKAYDHHASEVVRAFLNQDRRGGSRGRRLPNPSTPNGRKRFLDLDDWKAIEFVKKGGAGRHGRAILSHLHDRRIYETKEVAARNDINEFECVVTALREKGIDVWTEDATRDWHKVGPTGIVVGKPGASARGILKSTPLSECSDVVTKIPPFSKRLAFVSWENSKEAARLLRAKKGRE